MPMSQKPVVVVGSINIDLVANTESIPLPGQTVSGHTFQVHPGGKGANQAVAVSRLGYPVQLIGKVGTDVFGNQLLTYLESAGVDTRAVEVTDGSSGVAVIAVSAQGENSIIVVPGANDLVTREYVDSHIDIIRGAGIVLTQLEIPIDTIVHLAALCERERIPLVLDPSPAQKLPPEVLGRLCWLTPNETEAAFFSGGAAGGSQAAEPHEIASALLAMGMRGVVLKMGSRGAFLAAADGVASFISPYPVNAVDTTAAGDAFNGAFATGLMLHLSPQDAARFASAAAAISVTRPGAQPSMPTRAEVEQLLEMNRWKQAFQAT